MILGDMRGLFRGEMYTLLLPGTRRGELGNLYGLRGICGIGERVGGYKNKTATMRGEIKRTHLSDRACVKIKSYPGGGVLQDVGFQLLHEHLVVEDDDGVVVPLGDQHMLKGLQQTFCRHGQMSFTHTHCLILSAKNMPSCQWGTSWFKHCLTSSWVLGMFL